MTLNWTTLSSPKLLNSLLIPATLSNDSCFSVGVLCHHHHLPASGEDPVWWHQGPGPQRPGGGHVHRVHRSDECLCEQVRGPTGHLQQRECVWGVKSPNSAHSGPIVCPCVERLFYIGGGSGPFLAIFVSALLEWHRETMSRSSWAENTINLAWKKL